MYLEENFEGKERETSKKKCTAYVHDLGANRVLTYVQETKEH